jgi:hypothetical protein
MSQQTRLSEKGMARAGMFAQMPGWFDRHASTFSESPNNVHLTFAKPCVCGKAQQTVWVGKAKGGEKAKKLAAAVVKHHANCQQTSAVPQDPEKLIAVAQAEIARLDKAVVAQRKRAGQFEDENGLLQRKLQQGEAAQVKQSVQKRLKTQAAIARAPIVDSNQEAFGKGLLSHHLLAKAETPGGIVATLEYHCEGSHAKLLDIVTYLISRYDLSDEVAAQLGAGADETNKHIVQRARAALQELKKCGSEQQRQEYRVVLTALAPDHGRAGHVASALGVGRQKKPFLDAIKKRIQVDRMIELHKKSLQVGAIHH